MFTRHLPNVRSARFPRARRGMAALIAMLYLVLFSVMAMGFYAAVTTTTQIAHSDQKIAKAYLAAESGMILALKVFAVQYFLKYSAP